jgi:hypothetical protein
MRGDVTRHFNRFAGREVPMNEEQKTISIRGRDKTTITASPANPDEPVFREMSEEAQKHGLSLRALWPGKGYTDDYVRTRVNAHVEKGKDGKWRIANKFDLG